MRRARDRRLRAGIGCCRALWGDGAGRHVSRRLLERVGLGKFAIQLGRQIGGPVIFVASLRHIAAGQITPPLVRAFRLRMSALEARHTDDVDPPVAAILEAQYLDASDEPMLDDEMQLAADSSEEHTSELQSLMRTSYAVFCLNKKTIT